MTGCYDHVEQVLGALEAPYTTIDSRHLDNLPLRPEQLLVVNCPGEMSPVAIVRIRDFVANGGTLFPTDWALRHVVEPAFPGHVAYNGRSTGDDVVRIEVVDATSPYLAGVLDAENDPHGERDFGDQAATRDLRDEYKVIPGVSLAENQVQ